MPCGHASMLLLGEGSEATEPYHKYANLFKYISLLINLINPFGRHFCRPCDRRHIVAQMAGDEMSLTLREGSEATEPYNKHDKIQPQSIRSLQFDQKIRPLSFRPEKFDLFTATPLEEMGTYPKGA